MLQYVCILILVIIVLLYLYLTQNKKQIFKIYKKQIERKTIHPIDNEVLIIVNDINNNNNNTKNDEELIAESLIYYKNNYSKAKKAIKYELAEKNLCKMKRIINKYLMKLNVLENDMYVKSDNNSKTSCDVLDDTTVNEALKMVHSIIYMFNNTMDNMYLTFFIQYYEVLYDKYTLLYRYINKHKIIKIGEIETVFVSSHHEACEWIFKKYIGDKIPTILHVDSHPDMNSCINPKKMMNIKNKLDNVENLKELYTDVLSNNIGSVIIPTLYPYKENGGFYWLLPKWINIPSNAEKEGQLYEINDGGFESVEVDWGHNKGEKEKDGEIIIAEYEPFKTNTDYVENFYNYNHLIEDGYVLNIDIDYFVTIGEENVKYDNVSDNRTVIDIQRIKKDTIYSIEKNEELCVELDIIRKRIDDFLVLIKKLKDINKKPGQIILCNSSQRNINMFKEPWFNTELSIYDMMDEMNEYTPKYLSIWLQHTVLMHLKEIFE